MKKALLLTAVILALSLNACGGKSSENSLTSDDRTTVQNNSSIEATVGATELLEDATDHTGTESQPCLILVPGEYVEAEITEEVRE